MQFLQDGTEFCQLIYADYLDDNGNILADDVRLDATDPQMNESDWCYDPDLVSIVVGRGSIVVGRGYNVSAGGAGGGAVGGVGASVGGYGGVGVGVGGYGASVGDSVVSVGGV